LRKYVFRVTRIRMIIALYCVAAAMVLGGVYSAIVGWEIVILERGWTQVLSGVIVATGGVVLAAIAFLAGELRKLDASLRVRGDVGAALPARSESALAESNLEPARTGDARTAAAPLAGAAAFALAGFDKAKGALGRKGAVEDKPDETAEADEAVRADLTEMPALPDPQMPDTALADAEKAQEPPPGESPMAEPDFVIAQSQEPAPSAADEFLARAAEAEAREAEAREMEAREMEMAREENGSEEIGGDAPRNEGDLRDAVADALFAEDLARAVAPQQPDATEFESAATEESVAEAPVMSEEHVAQEERVADEERVVGEVPAPSPSLDTAPPAPDTPVPVTSQPDITEDEPSARPEIGEDLAEPANAATAMDAPEAALRDETARDEQEPESDPLNTNEAAISREREQFAALLASQTATQEPEYAPALFEKEPEPEIIPQPEPIPEPVPEPPPPPASEAEPEEAAQPVATAPEPEPEPERVPAPEPEPATPEPVAPEPVTPEPPPLVPERSVIGTYESGGNTYTMYADGSIDANTPDGNYHFGSLDELKTFIAEGGESRNG
jgi:hypothetical protein